MKSRRSRLARFVLILLVRMHADKATHVPHSPYTHLRLLLIFVLCLGSPLLTMCYAQIWIKLPDWPLLVLPLYGSCRSATLIKDSLSQFNYNCLLLNVAAVVDVVWSQVLCALFVWGQLKWLCHTHTNELVICTSFTSTYWTPLALYCCSYIFSRARDCNIMLYQLNPKSYAWFIVLISICCVRAAINREKRREHYTCTADNCCEHL